MANGPPTPPPTTATELQDEARGNLNVPPPASTAPTKQDPYQHIFPDIADLASQSNYQDLIQTAEISDLNVWPCFYTENDVKKSSRVIANARAHVC
jgi:COP9 signalosome complex subunit 8